MYMMNLAKSKLLSNIHVHFGHTARMKFQSASTVQIESFKKAKNSTKLKKENHLKNSKTMAENTIYANQLWAEDQYTNVIPLCFVQNSDIWCIIVWSFCIRRCSSALLLTLPHTDSHLQASIHRYRHKTLHANGSVAIYSTILIYIINIIIKLVIISCSPCYFTTGLMYSWPRCVLSVRCSCPAEWMDLRKSQSPGYLSVSQGKNLSHSQGKWASKRWDIHIIIWKVSSK